MVSTALWAALASWSWLEAAPLTNVLVSSTRVLAVFRIPSRWLENVSPGLSDWSVPGHRYYKLDNIG